MSGFRTSFSPGSSSSSIAAKASPGFQERVRSYQISSLYAPVGWTTWESLVEQWLDSQGDVNKLISFINDELAETWEEKSQQ